MDKKQELLFKNEEQKAEGQNQNDGSVKLEEKEDLSPEDKQQIIEEQKENGLVQDLTNKLTKDALLKLFYWLSVDDLVSVQRVCHSWRVAAHDPSLWNDYILELDFTLGEDKRKVIIMKGVRKISGRAFNDVFDLILENALHLKHMNCIFTPPMTSSQVGRLIEVSPQLESITIDLGAEEFWQSIEMLKSCQHLKEIRITPYSQTFVVGGRTVEQFSDSRPKINRVAFRSNMQQAFEFFADITNFPTLTSLDLIDCVSSDALENYTCSNFLVDIIARRSQQLLSLKVSVTKMSTDVLNSINMCSKLKILSVELSEECSVGVNIDSMPELQALDISIIPQKNTVLLRKLQDYFVRGTPLHLVEVSLGFISHADVDVLTAVVQNAKQLKKLCCYECEIDEKQLKDINSLPKLKHLSLSYLSTISPKVLSDISKIHNLQYLCLNVILTDDENLFNHVTSMMHSLKRLTYVLVDCDPVYLYLTDREAINEFLEDNPLHG